MTKPDPVQGLKLCRDCPIGCRTQKGVKKNKLAAYAALWDLDLEMPGFDEFVAAYHRRCDDIGLEAFETAAALAVGLKAGRVAAGFSGILKAVDEISRGTELGRILGNGAESAGSVWGLAPQADIGPRKKTGRSAAEEIFLDSTGLCAFAYSAMLINSNLWEEMDSMLKAKYGPSFDSDKLKNMASAIERLERS